MMEKILIEPKARFQLKRLCDSKHPEEVGGYLLGSKIDEDILIQDIFPVPNVHNSNRFNHYKEHSWGENWSNLYGITLGLKLVGSFHSHPKGTIPSQQDMKACRGLNVWVLHHGMGRHTFSGSRDFIDREVLLLNKKREIATKPHFVGDKFHLSTPIITNLGRIDFDGYSREVLKLKDETRRMLLLALKHTEPSGRVDLDRVVKESGRTRATVRKHLGLCLKKALLREHWRRGEYKVDFDDVL